MDTRPRGHTVITYQEEGDDSGILLGSAVPMGTVDRELFQIQSSRARRLQPTVTIMITQIL